MFELDFQTPIPSVQRAKSILLAQNKRFGIMLDYDRMLEYEAHYTLLSSKTFKSVKSYLFPMSRAGIELNDNVILDFLERNNFAGNLLLTDSGRRSLSEDSVEAAISTGAISEEVKVLLRSYVKAKHYRKLVSAFPTIYSKAYGVSKAETFDNHRMLILRPDWKEQNTGRLATANPGTLNISKEVGDIFTVPKGWVYVGVDSGQIEPRIIQSFVLRDPQLKKCTMMYNDAYFGYIHYCTVLTDEERRSGTLDLTPIEITDEMKAKRAKFKTYGNATMYGSTENREGDPDKDAFIRYIGGHPNRLKLVADIDRKLMNGVRVFPTAFGTEIDITNGPSDNVYKDKTSRAYHEHLIRCAINNPIQGTAGDLMRYSIEKAQNLLLRKAPNSYIMQYVHDAGKFAIHEKDYDNVIDDIREIVAYQVDDWIPVYAEAEEGVHRTSLKRFVE